MSFFTSRLGLPNTTPQQPVHTFKLCSKCNKSMPPEGGVAMRADKWVCAKCWARHIYARKG